ncbi:MAG: ATP synthase F1 subunit gamma [Candidatus Campbellbacteria bacterium]|nr:ATP synthase F1 subunit gamma [Candidatus Campbellbacteria bacterium]
MAGNTKAIKEKINTVGNLKKITRAMEMVARSKMKKAIDFAVSARPYTEYALELLANLSKNGDENNKYPLLHEGVGENDLVLHIASEKGLCGGYNAQALRSLESFISKADPEKMHIISVGKYADRHAEKTGAFFLQNFRVKENVEFREAQEISEFILERFKKGEYRRVFISYTNFETVFSQKNVVSRLLPITRESVLETIASTAGTENRDHTEETIQAEDLVEYKFEPSKEEVLEKILPQLVSVQVYQALLESDASEQSSRMVAMKNATDNASSLGEELSIRYNRARQASITNEIIEIAAGANAVK